MSNNDTVKLSFDDEPASNEKMESVQLTDGQSRIDAAQSAFSKGDAVASRMAHDAGTVLPPEQHGGAGSDVIKSIVFGGLDGVITTFATVAAVAGSGLDVKVLILMGFANLIADGISMGMGDFLSSKAEVEQILRERRREQWEYDNYPEGEKAEMIELYVQQGFEREDAETIINTYTKKPEYTKAFINHMMAVELGYLVPDNDSSPAKDGIVTFLSFMAFGSVPMWIYVIFYAAGAGNEASTMFAIACVATALTLFLLGFVKAKITKSPAFKSGILMMFNGVIAAAAAYLVGWALDQALNTSQCV